MVIHIVCQKCELVSSFVILTYNLLILMCYDWITQLRPNFLAEYNASSAR